MPTPEFVLALREKIGHDLLWLPAVTAVVLREDGSVLLARRSDNGNWGLVSGIVEPGEEPAVRETERLVVDQDPGGDQGPRQGAPAGLVGAGDEAVAERAVVGEEPFGPRQPAAVGLRGSRSVSAASRSRRPCR